MATEDDNDQKREGAQKDAEESSSIELAGASPLVEPGAPTPEEAAEEAPAAAVLGSERYVHAAFFTAGILTAYISSKVLALIWNTLAGWPAAVRAVPQLVSYSEEQRDGTALIGGAILGALLIIQAYRKESVRIWANEVAAELAKVSWPNRETVMNGTVVVVVASAIATVYVALLDRIWGFLTTLVYGA